VLPSAAIQRNSQTTYVYLVKPDQTVTIRNITVGTTEGDNSEILSGLEPNDLVVMTGVDKLQEGSKVQVHMADAQGNLTGTGRGRGGAPSQSGAHSPSGTKGHGATE
jgi:multidrug efflux system membrane fusion protein